MKSIPETLECVRTWAIMEGDVDQLLKILLPEAARGVVFLQVPGAMPVTTAGALVVVWGDEQAHHVAKQLLVDGRRVVLLVPHSEARRAEALFTSMSYAAATEWACARTGGGALTEAEHLGWLSCPERDGLYADGVAVKDYHYKYGPAWLDYLRRVRERHPREGSSP